LAAEPPRTDSKGRRTEEKAEVGNWGKIEKWKHLKVEVGNAWKVEVGNLGRGLALNVAVI
jgi:hypothetical protein